MSREFAREEVDWVWEVVWATGYLRVGRSAHTRGAEQAGSSSSAEVTEKKWQDQVDGVSDTWRKWVKKTVRFGGG